MIRKPSSILASLFARGKTPGKVKELQTHPYLKKKHFFVGTLPGYGDFNEHIINSYKMDIFGATLPMWDLECLLSILHFNLVANCAGKKNKTPYYQ